METDPLEIHHVVIKSEVYEDYTDGIEVKPLPVIIKSEVFEDDSDCIEVEPTSVVIKNEGSGDDIEVKSTLHTDDLNVERANIICCSSSASSLATTLPLVSGTDWDLNQCCRICAQKSSDMISLFGEEGLFRQLTQKMKDCLQIIVLESDDLPTAVCWKCVSKLEVCFELMQEYIRGQNVFQRQRFSQEMPLTCSQREMKMEYDEREQLTAVEQRNHIYDTHEGGLPLLATIIDENKDIGDVSCSGPSHVLPDDGRSHSSEGNVCASKDTNKGGTSIRVRKLKVSCEFCGKVFNHTGDLNKHRRRHTGEHPYPCPQCHKRFSHVSNLLRHQKIHSGETLHQCATCARKFSRKDKMVNHIKNSRCKPNPLMYT